jgi:adenylate cyclase
VAMARVKMLFDWDLKSARAQYERALELEAGCAAAHIGYASLLSALKETERSLEHARTAQSLEPLSLRIGVEYAWILYAARNLEQAVQQCWKVLALEPRGWMTQVVLGLSYQQLGMREEAIAEMQNAAICSGRHPVALGALGHLDIGNGEGILAELRELALRRYVNPLLFALVHAGLGQESAALACTRQAWEERDIYLHWLKQTSLLAPFMGANVGGSAH